MQRIYKILQKEGIILNQKTGRRINLGEHELKLLAILLNNHGVPQNSDDLFACAWPGKIVTRRSLIKAICTLRCALNDTPPYKVIINVPKTGYYLKSSSRALFLDNATGLSSTNNHHIAEEI